MSIRLTDVEIEIAKEEAIRLSWTHKAHPSYEKEKYLLEAQLKKVYAWLEENKIEIQSEHNGRAMKVVFDYKWQKMWAKE